MGAFVASVGDVVGEKLCPVFVGPTLGVKVVLVGVREGTAVFL